MSYGQLLQIDQQALMALQMSGDLEVYLDALDNRLSVMQKEPDPSMLLAIVSLPHGVGFTTKPTIEDIVHGRLSVIEVPYCNKYLLGLGVHDTVLIVWNNCEIYMIFAMRDKQSVSYTHLTLPTNREV